MIPRLEIVHRSRPLELMAPGEQRISQATASTSTTIALPRPAPYLTVMATLQRRSGRNMRTEVGFASGRSRITGWYDEDSGDVGLSVDDGNGRSTSHHSRRHGRVEIRPRELATTLTGTHVTLLCLEGDRWVARARHDLAGRLDTRDDAWLAGLKVGHKADSGAVAHISAGAFGQLGLRDLRFVTQADGTPLRQGEDLWLSATSAGPGFFDTAHTSIWRLDPATYDLTHSADLFFRRPDRPGVYGDHAAHVVRDGDRWLVATSTWGDFDRRTNPHVRTTLAETDADVLHGEHVLATRELPLPTTGLRSVGVWDPHLLRDGDRWHVGYASARRFFEFHPCVASGPSLDQLTLSGAATDRKACEGTTLLRVDGELLVLATDGRDGRRGQRAQFPVFDLALGERGSLDAPYPTNLPWPTLVRLDDGWLMATFNGHRVGGPLTDYGTHGDVVIMREA